MYYFIAFLVGGVLFSLLTFFITMNNVKTATKAKEQANAMLALAKSEIDRLKGKK